MLSLFILLAIISFILLIIGFIRPKWVVLWKAKESRKRKTVLVYFGFLFLGSILIILGLLINWLYCLIISTLVLGIIVLLCLFVGLIVPKKIAVFGNSTRKRILAQYGILSLLLFTLLIVFGATMSSEEVDDQIAGATYEGEYQNGLKHGEGKSFNHSSYYKGQWESDERKGYGVEYTDFGVFTIKYEGEWKNSKENGQGKMTMKAIGINMVYEGEWKDGEREGYGRFIDRSGNIYEGEWVNDSPNGKGKFTLKNGEIYEGEVKDWKRNGYGKAVSNDGQVLEGNWIDDELLKEE